MQDNELLKVLSSLPFFEHLEDDKLHELSSYAQILDFQKGEILYYEGDVKNKFYYLLEGEIKFYKVDRFDNEIFLYYLTCKSMITDTTHVGSCVQRPTYSTTEFTKKSKIIAFESDYFFKFINSNLQISSNFSKEVYKRIERLEKVISRDVIYDGTAKVAHMIIKDLYRFNNLKKHEIAYELHMQPETLSRILAKMIRNKIIKIEKNTLIVLNESELRQIYE